MATWIEPLDLFGLGRMWWRDEPGRECLTDEASRYAHQRIQRAVELRAPGCGHSRVVIEVAPDPAGRWWAGYAWRCWHVPDGTTLGCGTPLFLRADARAQAIARAAADCAAQLPKVEGGKARRIFDSWRRDLAALVATADSERSAA